MRIQVPVPLQRAFAVLSWERALPAFLPLALAFLFLFALAWSGAFGALPLVGQIIALTAAGILLGVLAMRGASRFQFPRRREALRRIEERSDLKEGILDGAFAHDFSGDEDNPLWVASRMRLIQAVGKPKAPLPRVSLQDVDPYRLRYVALAAVVVVVAATRGNTDGLRASLVPDFPEPAPIVVDAWIEPPAYTGLSPKVMNLDRLRVSSRAPEDSEFHIRVRDENGEDVRGVLTFQPPAGSKRRVRTPKGDGTVAVVPLTEDGTFTIRARGQQRQVRFRIIGDEPPSVRVVDDVDTSTGAIRFQAETFDDYPLADGRLLLTLLPGQKISRDAPNVDDDITETPQEIALAQLAGQPGIKDVEAATEEHPWAGLLVKAELEVTDGRGQTARSEPFAFTMPERTFYNPLSKAVIEERRKLAMAPSSLNRAAELFDALVLAPDLFDVEPSEHLMLKATAEAVLAAKQRDVPELIDSLWPLAIELEDDGLAFAKARLDEAEAALREALRNGASDEEISERIAELREAMNEYIRALAESGYAEAPPQEGGAQLGEADLEELLRRMEELAQEGATDEAESLLAQLEALLQSLQLSQGGQSGEGQQGQQAGQGQEGGGGQGQEGGSGALSGTGDLMQRQRELADETYGARRGDRGTGGLAQEQDELAEALRELNEGLEGEEGAAAGEAFENAERAMRDAARALENGQLGLAQARQEQALNALREGGNQLAEQMAENGEGEGGDPSVNGTDPLGRAVSGDGGPSPEDFGLYDPERIRELIADIRKRLQDPDLGEAEREYLESLLERF